MDACARATAYDTAATTATAAAAGSGYPISRNHLVAMSRDLVPGWLRNAIHLKSRVDMATKWFREIGYPDGLFEPSGYPISRNHLAAMSTRRVNWMAFRIQPGTISLEIIPQQHLQQQKATTSTSITSTIATIVAIATTTTTIDC